jgi:hypothetical protein
MVPSKSIRSVSVCLLLLVCLSTSLISCGQSQQTSSPVLSWIKQQALPLKTTDPQAPLDDLLIPLNQ